MLAISVEGTRSRSKNWRSGFYHIAHGAEVPVSPTFLDYGNKRGGFGLPIQLTDEISADMDKVRAFYNHIAESILNFEGQYNYLKR